MVNQADALIDTIVPELVTIRRDLHAHPETGFEEHRTAAVVAAKLRSWGLEVTEGIGRTGVAATVRGALAGQSAIAFRADMDALHIEERTGLPYASSIPKKMHACGHDGHTAILLGAAFALSRHNRFAGTVHFIFQPAEEGLGGGAAMIEDGLFERFPVDAIYGIHNWPGMPIGRFGTSCGALMAAGDTWTIVLRGKGGHSGASAHLANDVTVAQAYVLTALQTIVSRNVPARYAAVISAGYVSAGSVETPNVIPTQAIIRGTARCFDEEVRSLMERRIGEVAAAAAAVHGCSAEVRYERIFPTLVNDRGCTEIAVRAARAVVGLSHVEDDLPSISASEDFAVMLQLRPGNYMFFGNGINADGGNKFLHTSEYDFNDEAIPVVVRYLVTLAHQVLSM